MTTSSVRTPRRSLLATADFSSPAIVLAVFALIAAASGIALVLMAVAMGSPAVAPGTEARAGVISVWVDSSEWLASDHSENGDAESSDSAAAEVEDLAAEADSFAMPSSMMAGTPDEGYQRLQVDLSMLNRSAAGVTVEPDDFHLENGAGDTWPVLRGGTLNATTLGGNNTLNTVVGFDVAEELIDGSMFLVWSNGETTTRFSISNSGGDHG